VANVWQWKGLIEKHCQDIDPALVMAIIAQESRGDPWVTRDEGKYESVGLMQIMNFDWRPPSKWLIKPENNIFWGCNILRQLFARRDNQPPYNLTYDLDTILAVYNCGEVNVKANRCGGFGGYYYAEQILDHWKPLFDREYNYMRWERSQRRLYLIYKLKYLLYDSKGLVKDY
jgi:soluble lytic murein transglycosylase-like protein